MLSEDIKGSNSWNKSPYSKQEGVNEYLRDKHTGQTEGNTIYQKVSTEKAGDTSGYDTTGKKKLPMIKMQAKLNDVMYLPTNNWLTIPWTKLCKTIDYQSTFCEMC